MIKIYNKKIAKIYRQSPQRKAWLKKYYQTLEYKTYIKKVNDNLERKKYMKNYNITYRQTPQRKDYLKRYYQLPKYKDYVKKRNQSVERKDYMEKYGLTQKQKDYRKRYWQSPQGKLIRTKNQSKQSYKEYSKIYAKKRYLIPKVKMKILETNRRSNAKRKRNLGFVPIMNNPFPQEVKVDYHHINNMFVMSIPERLHETTLGKKHRMKSNQLLNRLGFDVNIFNKGGE